MFRIRRYRLFVICAAVVVFLLYRAGHNSAWDDGGGASLHDTSLIPPDARPKHDYQPPEKEKSRPRPADYEDEPAGRLAHPPPGEQTVVKIPDLKTSLEVKGSFGLPTPTLPQIRTTSVAAAPKKVEVLETSSYLPAPTKAAVAGEIPDRDPAKLDDVVGIDGQNEHVLHIQKPPGKHEEEPIPVASPSIIHWKRVPEHFPVDSIIPLPTGEPKTIPTVQYKFQEESAVAKEQRENRLAQVKLEMGRAWSGYKQYAWGHDEVKPVTKAFNDPFCGWAATLVDSMDTLWIMGMREEFDDAYAAVRNIDFTTTPYRSEIPVFETIIRYLGGLLAAYDVSGGDEGKYPLLLGKAVELAEILMGVFDTPNRMPVLYYNWKPAFASQPQRASTSVSVAELGSMSMEFTRLAQLTGENKYYDAIARITDAFEEWQNRPNGTALPGIFPQQIDASGCNRTATAARNAAREKAKAQAAADLVEPQGYTPASPGDDNKSGMPKLQRKPDIEFSVKPGSSPDEPGTGEIKKIARRDGASSAVDEAKDKAAGLASNSVPENVPPPTKHNHGPLSKTGQPIDWDCIPQNLTSGAYGLDSYSMGGSQDSAYEYFPKQYLLLGGLEPKYRAMHEKTIEAVKKYLLYRPMIQDETRNLLFSARVFSRDGTDQSLTADFEITHLTCFLGGMFGLGGKIFNRPEDVDIGARLADGCAWAYETMPWGVMPEYSAITPCKNVNDCPFNETWWHDRLDPNSEWRITQMKQYELRVEDWKVDRQKALRNEAERQLALEQVQKSRPQNITTEEEEELAQTTLLETEVPASDPTVPITEDLKDRDSLNKRDIDFTSTAAEMEEEVELAVARQNLDDEQIERKVKALEEELALNSANVGHDSSSRNSADQILMGGKNFLPPEPVRPTTHEEYVANQIKNAHLLPGFTSIHDPRYILRPEAIESVWYMYRITGDPEWQEKGWRMFQAVVKATRTEVAHSAVDNVARPELAPEPLDNMESFWTAETLKYFYLLFAEPDVISLDEWVLNTEAHPFRRPR